MVAWPHNLRNILDTRLALRGMGPKVGAVSTDLDCATNELLADVLIRGDFLDVKQTTNRRKAILLKESNEILVRRKQANSQIHDASLLQHENKLLLMLGSGFSSAKNNIP